MKRISIFNGASSTPTFITPPTATLLSLTDTTVPPTPTHEVLENPMDFVWSSTGAPNALNTLTDLETVAQGYLYVLDAGNSRVQVFDADGQFFKMWGEPRSGPGQFKFRRTNRVRKFRQKSALTDALVPEAGQSWSVLNMVRR